MPIRRADRLFDILRILRSAKAPVTAASIADELEVTVRTVTPRAWSKPRAARHLRGRSADSLVRSDLSHSSGGTVRSQATMAPRSSSVMFAYQANAIGGLSTRPSREIP